MKRLKDPDVHVPRFFERANTLGPKLGPVLWQLPPQLHRDDGRLESFLAVLPPDRRNAIEFRHPSWLVEPIYALLRRYGIALCLVDRDGQRYPSEPLVTTTWSYLRFHSGLDRGDYTEVQLREWASVIGGFRSRGVDLYVYFNNDWNCYAVKNARELAELATRGRP
jgi:uncharacterized protein YecE (DUF72 family)